MPRVIFKCPYLKGGSERAAAHLHNYVRYMATREGAQRVTAEQGSLPATKRQREMVSQLLREFPLSRGLFEYEDYQAAPTRANASEFITRTLEDNYDQLAKRDNYISYIASRPRAQRTGEHALFTGSEDPLVLSNIADEVAHHPGNVWLPIISLRREDAARLGYDDVGMWKELLTGYAMEMAGAMKIPWEQFRWYAAFHDESHHPHIHMVCYSVDGKSGFLTRDGIAQIKSGLAKRIFQQELHELYERQTQRRNELTQDAEAVMDELVRQMREGTLENPRIEYLMGHLAGKLKSLSGKKQYGYLKPQLKSVVDEIVEELAKDRRVARAYELWYELREEVLRTYREDLPPRIPLSRQKEFKRIRNMVIEEALRLADDGAVFAPTAPEEEPSWQSIPDEDAALIEDPHDEHVVPADAGDDETVDKEAAQEHGQQTGKAAGQLTPYAAYQLGRMFRDGVGCEVDAERAAEYFKSAFRGFLEWESGSHDDKIQYCIGWMLLHGAGTERDEAEARTWFEKSAGQGNLNARYQWAKIIFADPTSGREECQTALRWLTEAAESGHSPAQYELGKMYRDGYGVEKDVLQAAAWLARAAEQDSASAAYALGLLLLHGGEGLAKDVPAALSWLEHAAEAGNQFAQYRLGKLLFHGEEVPKDIGGAIRWLTESAEQGNQYAQYALGKLYLLGQDVKQDSNAAAQWFARSAAQGNEYAQYMLDHMKQGPSILSCATRLLHHLSGIFREQNSRGPVRTPALTDRKLRQRIREKKIAMGHKPDDHEEETMRMQ